MGMIKIYEPVLKPTPKSTSKDWFTVCGARSEDREEAIRLVKQHCSFKDGRSEIGRVDEFEVDAEEYYRHRIY